jgi:polyisoprenoid-binding protein YceI
MKKILTVLSILAILIIVVFLYATRGASAPTELVETPTEATSTPNTYRINPEMSTVSFSIGEDLRGSRFTAIGATNQVSTDVTVSPDGSVSVGTVSVNARTFKTDDSRRDGAIARLILKSENPENEYITFTPTPFTSENTPKLVDGTEITFPISGSLTISGVTKPVTLTATLSKNADILSGTVEGEIKRSDFGITIPSLSFIANVDDVVVLKAGVTLQ